MASRLYFTQATEPTVTPVVNGVWNDVSQSTDWFLLAEKTGIILPTNAAGTLMAWTAGNTARERRFISGPLGGDQLIQGTVTSYRYVQQETAGTHARDRLEIYVVSNDGQTVRGTLLPIGGHGTQADFLTNNAANYRDKSFALAGTALTAVHAKNGDRIVVVFGMTDASGTTPSARGLWSVVTANTDAPQSEADTNSIDNPWIEFSQTLTFAQPQMVAKASGSNNASFTTLSTGAATPTTGNLGLIFIWSSPFLGNLTSPVPTMSSTIAGLTLDLVDSMTVSLNGAGATFGRLSIFRYQTAASLGSGTITADWGAQAQGAAAILWHEIDHVLQGANGADAVLAVTRAGPGPSPQTVTLSTPAGTVPDNFLVVATMQLVTFPSDVTYDVNWLTIDKSAGAGFTSEGVAWRPNTVDRTVVASATGSGSADQVSIGLEIISDYVPTVPVSGGMWDPGPYRGTMDGGLGGRWDPPQPRD